MTGKKLIKASPEERHAFGERLEEAWEAAGYQSQSELAAVVGVKPQTVHFWAAGRSMPKSQKLEELAHALGVSVSWLLTGDAAASEEGEGARRPWLEAGAYESEFKAQLSRLGREEESQTQDLLRIGGFTLAVDFACPSWVMEIKHIRSPHGLEDQVSGALWRLAVVMNRDRWLGITRTYLLVLIGPGLGGSGAGRKLEELKGQAEVMGIEIVRSPDPQELAQKVFNLEQRGGRSDA
jgi:transcriptional regulator with XRE-family HTH domain